MLSIRCTVRYKRLLRCKALQRQLCHHGSKSGNIGRLNLVLPRAKGNRIARAASASTLSVYLHSSVVPLEWINGAFGGLMLGSSTSLMIAFHGRVAGISGLLTKFFDSVLSRGNANKLATCSQLGFLTGMFASGIYWNYRQTQQKDLPIAAYVSIPYSPTMLCLGGLLVGLGTRLGSGCTSGHGIVGLGRRSLRSFAAVGAFFGCSMVTATAMHMQYPNLFNVDKHRIFQNELFSRMSQYAIPVMTGLMLCGSVYVGARRIGQETVLSLLPSLTAGGLFGTGLVYSGMAKPEKIHAFLNVNPNQFSQHWDPTLMCVFAGALLVSAVSIPVIVKALKQPILSKIYHLPSTMGKIDRKLLIGSSIFGVGWGMSGLCPGPAVVGLTSTEHGGPVYLWAIGFVIGNRLAVLFL